MNFARLHSIELVNASPAAMKEVETLFRRAYLATRNELFAETASKIREQRDRLPWMYKVVNRGETGDKTLSR